MPKPLQYAPTYLVIEEYLAMTVARRKDAYILENNLEPVAQSATPEAALANIVQEIFDRQYDDFSDVLLLTFTPALSIVDAGPQVAPALRAKCIAEEYYPGLDLCHYIDYYCGGDAQSELERFDPNFEEEPEEYED